MASGLRPGAGFRPRTRSFQDAYREKLLRERDNVIPFDPAERAARSGTPVPAKIVSFRAVPDPEPVVAHFPPWVRDLILARPVLHEGRRCELEGFAGLDCWGPIEAHHREGKGSGGSIDPRLHVAANGVAACAGAHHPWIHHHPEYAGTLGLIVSRFGGDFYTTPVSFDGGHTRRRLDDAGHYEFTNPLGGDAS